MSRRSVQAVHTVSRREKRQSEPDLRRPRRRARDRACCCCRATVPFCWTCNCGFSICQQCMAENLWGMTCNRITWWCPDCGRDNSFGNQ